MSKPTFTPEEIMRGAVRDIRRTHWNSLLLGLMALAAALFVLVLTDGAVKLCAGLVAGFVASDTWYRLTALRITIKATREALRKFGAET